ncbi:sterol 3beta-glucosyltransferase [Saccharothrix saharensis]|uniref:Sterol 3beta-glucosyltransferase n=1 Tax=Saccharothrix saharensis TaxID=571190 RepID=A0A543J948_9PSEU|nr:glycosyltransferase [Saccharothrix saharensis]TQM79339.1 sterol 3beta-glucosyltransferase [Saccharothrix saharensis]
MRALLVTHGTRGDVQPMLALAVALRRAGHGALLAAPHSAAALAAGQDVEFAGLDEGPNRLLDDPLLRQAVDGGYRGLRGKVTAVRTARRIKPLMADVLRDLGGIARGSAADVVVHTPTVPAQHVAELLDVPAVLAALQPGWVPTAAFPCPMLPLPRLPKILNRASYAAVGAMLRAYAGTTDRWRVDQLGLARRRGGHDLLHDRHGRDRLVLQAFSPLITPVAPDWPSTVRTTGFWYLPDTPWTPPAGLEDFLSDGPPPVYVGFGSMAGRDAARTGRLVVDAVREAGVRAVLATGWGGIAPPSAPGVHVIDHAPHQWLFPWMSAVVHHGGAGTTAAALAAGVPQVVCPFVADQPHWARCAHAVGVAPPPIRRQHLTATTLGEAIGIAVHDTAMRLRARELGDEIRTEDGVTRAVTALADLGRRNSVD